jgi:hypothetical protein
LLSACYDRQGVAAAKAIPDTLSLVRTDTLRSGNAAVVARAELVSIDPQGRYIIGDRSDRDIKVFSQDGTWELSIGGVGVGAGQFMTLMSAGVLGHEVFAYDATNLTLTFFRSDGRYSRSYRIAGARDPRPSDVRPVDDSLLLVMNFSVGAEKRNLLRLIRPDGSTKAEFLSGTRFYKSAAPDVIQFTHVLADARDGVVFAGLFGSDSLFAFDYSGKLLGAGQIMGSQYRPIPAYEPAILANHGRMLEPDGKMVTTGFETLLRITALDRWHAALQIVRADFRTRTWMDPTDGGVLELAWRDTAEPYVRTGVQSEVRGGLLGRDRDGHALVLRYLGNTFDALEVAHFQLAPRR